MSELLGQKRDSEKETNTPAKDNKAEVSFIFN